jgi:hypothetical protein
MKKSFWIISTPRQVAKRQRGREQAEDEFYNFHACDT